MKQEMTIISMKLPSGFLLWIILAPVQDIQVYLESSSISLRYALFLFSFPSR